MLPVVSAVAMLPVVSVLAALAVLAGGGVSSPQLHSPDFPGD
jgi:hypothetical protein